MIFLALFLIFVALFHFAIRLGVDYEQMDASFPLFVVAAVFGVVTTVLLYAVRSLL